MFNKIRDMEIVIEFKLKWLWDVQGLLHHPRWTTKLAFKGFFCLSGMERPAKLSRFWEKQTWHFGLLPLSPWFDRQKWKDATLSCLLMSVFMLLFNFPLLISQRPELVQRRLLLFLDLNFDCWTAQTLTGPIGLSESVLVCVPAYIGVVERVLILFLVLMRNRTGCFVSALCQQPLGVFGRLPTGHDGRNGYVGPRPDPPARLSLRHRPGLHQAPISRHLRQRPSAPRLGNVHRWLAEFFFFFQSDSFSFTPYGEHP